MPATVPGMIASLVPCLSASGMLGTGLPKYALGVATGVSIWLPQVKIQTVDTGTAGAGAGTPTPIIIAVPVLYANLVAGMISQGLSGTMMPAMMLGLANGLAGSFAQGVTSTLHPSVGVGAAVATFKATPATPSILAGFASAGLLGDGPAKKARAIGSALDRTFASLILPIAIVGPPSTSPSAGTGVGNII